MAMTASSIKGTRNRWLILLAAIVSMIAIANYQYGWTLFVNPINKKFGFDIAAIQVTFTVFVLLETWLVPFEGALVDKFGPKLFVIAGGVLCAIGWSIAGTANSLSVLYLGAGVVSGLGAGIVYGTAVGTALKWFPDHRGLAAGLTAAGFGAGSALTVGPISDSIASTGYQNAFIQWGIVQGVVVVIAALLLAAPPKGWAPAGWSAEKAQASKAARRQSPVDFTPKQMAKTKQFWVLYVMMTMVATGGLIATASIAPIANQFKIANLPVSLLFVTQAAVVWTLQMDRVLNGLTRPFFGYVSDHIGRENTMSLAFTLEALAIIGLIQSLSNPLLFVLFSGFTFFGWGEIYSLFPATSGDFFGRKFATTNYGFLYTAKGTASIFVPIGTILALGSGVLPNPFPGLPGLKLTVSAIGWQGVFMIPVIFDLIAAFLAFTVLKRMKVPVPAEIPPQAVRTPK